MKPFLLDAQPVARVWGGHRLAELRGFSPAEGQPVGESWEVHGTLPVRAGPYQGRTLDAICQTEGTRLLGNWSRSVKEFPLLTKWLDCRDWLSIQVHPDDQLAAELHGHCGKNEAWFFWEVAEPPGGEVIHGFVDGTPTGLPQLGGGDWLPHLRRFRPQTGEWIYTPAGTVHALGPGLLLYEVQQSSDLTYRIYDWDRPGLDGQPRQLHLQESVRAVLESRPPLAPPPPPDCIGEIRVLCWDFCIEQVEGSRTWSPEGNSVELLACLDSETEVRCGDQTLALGWGDTLVVPASAQSLDWQCGPKSSWIRVRLVPAGPA